MSEMEIEKMVIKLWNHKTAMSYVLTMYTLQNFVNLDIEGSLQIVLT